MPASAKHVVLFLSIFLPFVALAQNARNENKIDLPFRILIAQQKETDSVFENTKPSKKTVHHQCALTDTSAKKYECIIYTKNAGALRKKGVIVRSELPTFVTALATLKQIEEAAAMPEVTSIEAPEYLKTHAK